MGDFWLQPLRSLSDLEDAKRAARHINDHSLAKMVTRKKKVRKSKKEAFQSVLLAPRSCQESIPPKSVVSSTSTDNQECSSKPCQKRQIQLFVNSSLTSPVCLQLHPSTTISALKGLLQDKVGIEPEKQHLFTRKNHELRDDLSLGNYGIEQDTNIELRLVSGLMGGADEQKTKGRRKTKRKQTKSTSREEMSRQSNSNEESQVRSSDDSCDSPPTTSDQSTERRKKTKRRTKKSGKKTTSTEEMSRQSDSDEEGQVRSTDESGDSPTTTSDQSTGRKKRRRQQRHVEKEPSYEEAKKSTTLDEDDSVDSQTCSSIAGGSATNFDKLDLFLWILCLPLITIHVILSICSPRMIQVNSSSKDGTNRPTFSGAEQENSDDSGHSSTSAAKHGRKRTRRRRQGKARQNTLDEADSQTTSENEKRDHSSDGSGDSNTSVGKPEKIQRRGMIKKKSGKTRKGQRVAKKSRSEEEAVDETSKADKAEDKLVTDSRDSTVSSSVKTTAKRNNQSKGDSPERTDNDSARRQGKRKATKTKTSSSREENADNSEDSSISSAVKAPAGNPSGETQEEAETNTKSLGDTDQHILHDPGDSCSSATIGTAASASSETVAGTGKTRERLETAGSEAEESNEKTVASDRQQVDTGSSSVSASVTASSASRSKGSRTRKKRKNPEKTPEDGDSQVLDLDRLQPEDQNVAGVMELNLQQGKGTALEQQRPKDQKTEEKDNHKEISSSETQGVNQEKDYGPDKLKSDDLSANQTDRTRRSHLKTMPSPEHPELRCKQDDCSDRPSQFEKQEQEAAEQSCRHVPEEQAVRREGINETCSPQPESGIREHGLQKVQEVSPGQLGHDLSSQQGIATCDNQGVEQKQASHHAQIPQQDKQKVAGVGKQSIQQSITTSPEHHRMRQERDDDLNRPDAKIQSTLEAGEQSSPEEMMTSAKEKPGPDRLHKENLSPEQLQVVRDLVPSAVQPAMQHPSTLCTPTSDSIQPTVQTGDVNVPGSCNPVFLGSSSGHTFHYEFNQNVTIHQEATTERMENGHHPAQHIKVSSPSVQTSQGTNPATDGAADAAADQCEEALKKVYKTTGSYVRMIPWVDDDMVHIVDIYTKLRLVTDELQMIWMPYEDGKEVTYEDAFLLKNEDGVVINRIIYEGLAGLGKTTLIGKIAHDWATISSGPLAKYKLVFVLRMSALEQTADLIDSLYEQLIDPNIIDKKHLKTFIFKNPQKVLILLDGFDELMTTKLDSKSFGSILQILNRKVGADIDVVITTRTSHFCTLVSRSLVEKPFTHVKVLGFFDFENYLGKFFSKSPNNADSLFESIQSSAVLLDLAHSPMILLLMCLLWRQDSPLPNTLLCLYDEAQRYIFKRKGIPEEEIPEIVVAIGKVALHGLVSPVQRLSFQEKEFEESVLEKALKAGILTSQRDLKMLITHNNVQFIHKTFQELCAAFYLQSLQESDADEFRKKLDKRDDMDNFRYLLRFCCGDNEDVAEEDQ